MVALTKLRTIRFLRAAHQVQHLLEEAERSHGIENVRQNSDAFCPDWGNQTCCLRSSSLFDMSNW